MRMTSLDHYLAAAPFVALLLFSLWAMIFAPTSRCASDKSEFLDAAPFGELFQSDPHRTDGARNDRVQSFDAEDLFLDRIIVPDESGQYVLDASPDGVVSIGVRWYSPRVLRNLQLHLASSVPSEIQVQYWEGATLWQGNWRPLSGSLSSLPDGFAFEVSPERSTLKIRWVIPSTESSVRVAGIVAETASKTTISQFRIQAVEAHSAATCRIEIINGCFLQSGQPVRTYEWAMAKPLVTDVLRTANPTSSTEATLLRFRLSNATVTVSLKDVLEHKQVWLPDFGLFVSCMPSEATLHEYLETIQGKQTILQEVEELPEQNRHQAMAKTHYNPDLDTGLMMLSLACGNSKFITDRKGAITFVEDYVRDERGRQPSLRLTPMFGKQRLVGFRQEWGKPGINKAAHAIADQALPLQINDKHYAEGLGTHANGEILIDLQGEYSRFRAEVGLQWQGGTAPGSVVFEVLIDGAVAFQTGVMREHGAPRLVDLDVTGAERLTLRVGDAGDGIGYDAANWAEAKLTPADSSQPEVSLTDFIIDTPKFKRHLSGGWLPAPVVTREVGGLLYSQRTFVVPCASDSGSDSPEWFSARPLCVAENTIINHEQQELPVRVTLQFGLASGSGAPPEISINGERAIISSSGRTLAIVEVGSLLSLSCADDMVTVSGTLSAGANAQFHTLIPGWNQSTEETVPFSNDLFARFEEYWNRIMSSAMQVDTPDPWLDLVIKANQVHIFCAARNEDNGARVVPWIASDRYYSAIDSEGNSVIRGMMYWGHTDYAKRSFEFFFSRYNPEGFMTTGYTLMGNGWHLWTLGEFMRLMNDREWFSSVQDRPLALCRWIQEQLAKTKRTNSQGERVPEYGLMPPGVQADWSNYAYYFYLNGYFYAGLKAMGETLKTLDAIEASEILATAQQLRTTIIGAFRVVQAQAPVVPLNDGTWIPYFAASVYTPGKMADFFPGQDGNRSWAYDVDLGAHHLVPQGVLKPTDRAVDWMCDHMEDVDFLSDGWGGYPATMNHNDWFNMGGFAKVQPYYCRIAEIYALRNEVKPFLRSYFNTLASLIDGEVLSIFEHFSNFCYNKTHETGYFLHQSRTLLLMERGDELWLAPFAPQDWFEDGKTLSVRNAPSLFGSVSYTIESFLDSGYIEAVVEPFGERKPGQVVLRFREPGGLRVRQATLNGRTLLDCDAETGTVRLVPVSEVMRIRVDFMPSER